MPWTGPPCVRYVCGREVTYQLHYTAMGSEIAERILEHGRETPNGGLNSSLFELDYELNLKEAPGISIFGDFDEEVNVLSVDQEVLRQFDAHILSTDFGASRVSVTAMLAGVVTPKQTIIYYEYQGPDLPASAHKERLRLGLAMRLGLTREWTFSDLFVAAVGDVSGTGYKLEYKQEPYPIHFMPPSEEAGWRDRNGSEAFMNGMLAVAKRCCYSKWPSTAEVCGACGEKLEYLPGLVIDPSCTNLLEQIPTWKLVDGGVRDKHKPHDYIDTCMYLCRKAGTLGPSSEKEEKEPAKKPWWWGAVELAGDDGARRLDMEYIRAYGSHQGRESPFVDPNELANMPDVKLFQ